MEKNRKKLFAIAGTILILTTAVFHFLIVVFGHMAWWQALIADVCYVILISIPTYAGITKGDKAYSQPSKKIHG